jgi:MFS family permease
MLSMSHMRRRVLLLSLSISAAGLPIYLIDTVAPQIQRNLHLTAADFGIINAVWFAASSASALVFGRRVDRKGGDSVMAIAVPTLSLSLLSVVLIQSFAQFLAAVVVCGLAGGAIPSSVYRVVWDSVPTLRMGLAFGVVQSGFAAAAVLTGVAGPWLASALGWRPVFALCAGVVLGIGMLFRRALAQPEKANAAVARGRSRDSRSSNLPGRARALKFSLVTASIVANGATGALVTYLVLALVHRGLSDLVAAGPRPYVSRWAGSSTQRRSIRSVLSAPCYWWGLSPS